MRLKRTLFIYLHPLPKHTFILMTLLTTDPTKEPSEGHSHRCSSQRAPQFAGSFQIGSMPKDSLAEEMRCPTLSLEVMTWSKTISDFCPPTARPR
jgi:hypothetical protein